MKKLYVFNVKRDSLAGVTEDGEDIKTNLAANKEGFDVEFVTDILKHKGFRRAYEKHCSLERSRGHGM